MRNEVVITGSFRFPDGDAAAARVLGIGKALRDLGYTVTFAGWEEHPRAQDVAGEGYAYEGFQYFSQADLRAGHLSPRKRLMRYLNAGANTLSWLQHRDNGRLRAIIAYHGNSRFLLSLRKFCKSRNVDLIVDCTEWYDPRNLPGGILGLPYLDSELRMRFVNRLIGKLIVISKYLESYYSTGGARVERVPPTVDLSDSRWNVDQAADVPLTLIYAGSAGNKDLLAPVLLALRVLKNEGSIVKLHLVGPTRGDALKALAGSKEALEDLASVVAFHGRVPQAAVPPLLKRATFSILLRPQERYAHAGFSTKLVESFAAGVPVIANRTGEIAEYLEDGANGLLIDGHDSDAVIKGLRRALRLDDATLLDMRLAARATALQHFSYESYATRIGTLLSTTSPQHRI